MRIESVVLNEHVFDKNIWASPDENRIPIESVSVIYPLGITKPSLALSKVTSDQNIIFGLLHLVRKLYSKDSIHVCYPIGDYHPNPLVLLPVA